MVFEINNRKEGELLGTFWNKYIFGKLITK